MTKLNENIIHPCYHCYKLIQKLAGIDMPSNQHSRKEAEKNICANCKHLIAKTVMGGCGSYWYDVLTFEERKTDE